jgi:FtsZ-binding cell division protein ZapB
MSPDEVLNEPSKTRNAMSYVQVLQNEIEELTKMLQPHDTGHINTAISVLRERIKTVKESFKI